MKNILLIITFLMLAGCYKDIGNYTYTDEPRIEIRGVENTYRKVAMLEDPTLSIPVIITTEYPESELFYSWSIGRDTISLEKNLRFDISNAPINLRPGAYNLVLAVEHRANASQEKQYRYTVYATAVLSVETKFSRGFYVLKETSSGNTDMDFFILEEDFGKQDLEAIPERFNVEDAAINVLAQMIGEQLEGNPQVLAQLTYHPFIDPVTGSREVGQCLGITTDQTIAVILCRDMIRVTDPQTLFWDPDASIGKPGRFFRTSSHAVYLSDNGCYSLAAGSAGTGRFGPPAVVDKQGGSRWAVPLYGNTLRVIFWDEINGRFLTLVTLGNNSTTTPYSGPANPDDPQPNGITDKMLYMGGHYPFGGPYGSSDPVYAIMQPEDTSDRKLYRLTHMDTRPETPIDWVFFPGGDKFNTATHYALNAWDIRMLYYVADGELYCRILGTTPQETGPEERLFLQGFPAGEQVTYVSNRFWWSTLDPNFRFNYLVVGSSKGDGTYTISMYETMGGRPQGNPKVQFSGLGSIADIQYMAPRGGNGTDISNSGFPAEWGGSNSYALSYN